jgi:DUF1009 family protein
VQPKPDQPPIALLMGRGELPRVLVEVFKSQKRPYLILAFKGQADEDFVSDLPHVWLNFGEVGKAFKCFEDHHIKEIVTAGSMTRPALSELRPDWEGLKWLGKIGKKALGDDNLLKFLIEMVESQGYHVVGPTDILTELLAPEGLLTSEKIDDQAWQDIGRGIEVLTALSPADVGQAVVVQEGLVLGIEAIEGTDRLIERVALLKRPGLGSILVKMAKRQQENRVDLPTVGLGTIQKAAESGLRGIAIEAGRTLILNREEMIQLAQDKGIFVVGLASAQCHPER